MLACLLPSLGCRREVDAGARGTSGPISVKHAVAWSAADVKAVTIGMEIGNDGDAVDTLVGVTSPLGAAMLHTEVPGEGMRPVPALPLQRHTSIRIGRGLHVMVESLQKTPSAGATIPITLRFARAGAIDLSVPVLKYSDALTALGE